MFMRTRAVNKLCMVIFMDVLVLLWCDFFVCCGVFVVVCVLSIDIGGVKVVVFFIGGVNSGVFDGVLRIVGSDFGVLNDGCGNVVCIGVFLFLIFVRKVCDFFNVVLFSFKVVFVVVWNIKFSSSFVAGGVAAAAFGCF